MIDAGKVQIRLEWSEEGTTGGPAHRLPLVGVSTVRYRGLS